MPATPDSLPFDPARHPEEWAVLGAYRTANEAHEAGLAILAVGRSYWVHVVDGRFLLVVPSAHAEASRREIELFEEFNRNWPPRPLELPEKRVSKVPTVAAVLILGFVFWIQQRNPGITAAGINGTTEVLRDGEGWRLVTATTLHADPGHLAGNLFGLSLFAYLAARYLGNGLGWMLILAAAVCANLCSVLFNAAETYRSLGASTAVFAALGLLTGFPVGSYLRAREPLQQRDWLIPFFAGCLLFAWMGGGEFPTDVFAHLWAFAFGMLFALLAAATALPVRLTPFAQGLLLAGGGALPSGAWLMAGLNHGG